MALGTLAVRAAVDKFEANYPGAYAASRSTVLSIDGTLFSHLYCCLSEQDLNDRDQ
jgi:hypothetical protein